MKQYTPKQVNIIKQEIRTGKPLPLIAKDLATEWGRPLKGIYGKVVALSRKTYKINNTWKDDSRMPAEITSPVISENVQQTIDFAPIEEEILDIAVVEEEVVISQEIVEQEDLSEVEEIVKPPVQQPAQIEVEGIEVPANNMAFIGTPSRVVIYRDHVRYYYSNENN